MKVTLANVSFILFFTLLKMKNNNGEINSSTVTSVTDFLGDSMNHPLTDSVNLANNGFYLPPIGSIQSYHDSYLRANNAEIYSVDDMTELPDQPLLTRSESIELVEPRPKSSLDDIIMSPSDGAMDLIDDGNNFQKFDHHLQRKRAHDRDRIKIRREKINRTCAMRSISDLNKERAGYTRAEYKDLVHEGVLRPQAKAREYHRISDNQLLLKCGDVEENPGPYHKLMEAKHCKYFKELRLPLAATKPQRGGPGIVCRNCCNCLTNTNHVIFHDENDEINGFYRLFLNNARQGEDLGPKIEASIVLSQQPKAQLVLDQAGVHGIGWNNQAPPQVALNRPPVPVNQPIVGAQPMQLPHVPAPALAIQQIKNDFEIDDVVANGTVNSFRKIVPSTVSFVDRRNEITLGHTASEYELLNLFERRGLDVKGEKIKCGRIVTTYTHDPRAMCDKYVDLSTNTLSICCVNISCKPKRNLFVWLPVLALLLLLLNVVIERLILTFGTRTRISWSDIGAYLFNYNKYNNYVRYVPFIQTGCVVIASIAILFFVYNIIPKKFKTVKERFKYDTCNELTYCPELLSILIKRNYGKLGDSDRMKMCRAMMANIAILPLPADIQPELFEGTIELFDSICSLNS